METMITKSVKSLGSILVRLLFPDFSNRLTWTVLIFGIGLVAVPHQLLAAIARWIVQFLSQMGMVLPPVPEYVAQPDPWGYALILVALGHNLAAKVIATRADALQAERARDQRLTDVVLYEKFLALLPTDGPAINLVKDHDFANSFVLARLENLYDFDHIWRGAEYCFLQREVEAAKVSLLTIAESFLLKVSQYTSPRGQMQTVYPRNVDPEFNVPDFVKSEILELNSEASDVYQAHQLFVRTAKEKL